MTLSSQFLPQHVLKQRLTGLALVWGWVFLASLHLVGYLPTGRLHSIIVFIVGGKLAVWLGLVAGILFYPPKAKPNRLVTIVLTVALASMFALILFFVEGCFAGTSLFFIQPFNEFTSYQAILMALSVCILFCGGFIFMLVAVEKNWIYDYPFYYPLIKYWFKVGLTILTFWLLLHQFHIYQKLLNTKIGQVIYLVDYLSIELVLAELVLCILVFFEDFSWGKIILSFFENLSRYWIILLVLFLLLYLIIAFKPIADNLTSLLIFGSFIVSNAFLLYKKKKIDL